MEQIVFILPPPPELENSIGGLGNAIGMQGWNQLVYDYNFSGASNWMLESGTATLICSDHKAIITVTGSSDSRPNIRPRYIIPSVSGHKYYFSVDCRFHSANFSKMTFSVLFGSSDAVSIPIDTDYRYCKIITSNADPSYVGQLYIDQKVNTLAVGDTFEYKNYNIIDLTQLFGAGNEPETVEEFKLMFPANYYPYCSGNWANLLWTNSNPTATFGPQTIIIPNIIIYDKILITCKRRTSQSGVETSCILDINGAYSSIIDHPAYQIAARDVIRYGDGIEFGNACLIATLGNGTINNDYLIPYKIYGIK